MARGRLIFPFLADIRRLDTVATNADPDGAGPATSGYNPLYREPIILPAAGKPEGVSARKEFAQLLLPCQVEDNTWQKINALANGNSPEGFITLVFHYKDLEKMSLVDAAGKALLKPGDRLEAIQDMKGNLVETVLTPPGLYIKDAVPAGHGLGTKRNLLIVTWQARTQGI